MLLKFKNKYIMALDKMIKEANDIGGMIDNIVLDMKEGYELILEIVNLGAKKFGQSGGIKITDLDGVDITKQELLWSGTGLDKNEHVKGIINSWYKLHIQVKYDGIPLMLVKPKAKEKPKTLPAPTKKAEGWMDEEKTPSVAERIENDWGEKLGYDPVPPLRRVPPEAPAPPAARSVTGKEVPDVTVKAPDFDTTTESFPPMKPMPEGPPNRIIQEGNVSGYCEKCGSSLKTKFFFFKAGGCIQPECENYWEKVI